MLVAFSSSVVYGQSDVDISDVEPSDIQIWVENDIDNKKPEIRAWLNSNRSEQYTELRTEAENYIDKKEEQREDLSGTKQISQGLRVTGYEFDAKNESIKINLQADSPRGVSITDLGGAFEGGRYDYEVITVTGNKTIKVSATRLNVENEEIQAVSITDGKEEVGNTIRSAELTSGRFIDKYFIWMLALAPLMGVIVVAVRSRRYIDNIKDRYKGEFVSYDTDDYLDVPDNNINNKGD